MNSFVMKQYRMRHYKNVVTFQGGSAPLLLNHIPKQPMEGSGITSNTIVGIKGGYKPAVMPASATPIQSIAPPPMRQGGELLNSITFTKNMKKNQKRDNIKFNF